jgi:hypothetical protein
MSFTPSDAGKGPQNRLTSQEAFRSSPLWWRSQCCNAKVTKIDHPGDDQPTPAARSFRCLACTGLTTLRP